MHRPLADEIRPLELDEVVGQKHILGEGGLLRRVIESGDIPNMVFYGPSGTGKTTVANIIARRTERSLRKLNATNAGLADIKAIIAELDTMLTPGGAGAGRGGAHLAQLRRGRAQSAQLCGAAVFRRAEAGWQG